jgi:chromosome segregation ATPase
MTNLIERLRETASKGVSVWGDLQMEAADTIEALFNRNRQLVVESSKYCAEVSRGMSDTIRLMAERDALKAELNTTEVLLEECKMDWSGDVTQIKAEHKHEVDTLRQQLASAMQLAQLNGEIGAELKADKQALEAEVERLKGSEIGLDRYSAKVNAENKALRQQLAEAQAEIKRLQVEVSNRNRRALEGDKAQAAFDRLYTEHEELRLRVEASRKQKPVYAFRRKGLDDFCTCSEKRFLELSSKQNLFEVKKFYAAPVVADDVQRDAERMKVALSNAEDALSNWKVWALGQHLNGFGKTCEGANDIALELVKAAMKGAA